MNNRFNLNEEQIVALVREFQPIIYQPQHDKYEPKFMYYRTRIRGNLLQITYYTVWDNERHPRYILHVLYAFLFRKFYYGSIKDIEYIQVDVDLINKSIVNIRYDQPHNQNYHVMIPFHKPNQLKRVPQPQVGEPVFIKFHGKENQFHGLIKPRFKEKRVQMLVASWNHIYDVYLEDLGDKVREFQSLMLEKFDYKAYKKYKAYRRRKGDF